MMVHRKDIIGCVVEDIRAAKYDPGFVPSLEDTLGDVVASSRLTGDGALVVTDRSGEDHIVLPGQWAYEIYPDRLGVLGEDNFFDVFAPSEGF